MKKFWRWFLITLGFVVPTTSSCTSEEMPFVPYSNIELEIFSQVNEVRRANGNIMCRINNNISQVAKIHSQFLADSLSVSHDNFAQRAEILICKIDAKSVAEVVGFGYNSANGLVNGWIKSESHNKIIFGKGWTDFGVSAVQNDKGRYYFTLIFTRQ